jgi:hypothetical protein
MPAEVGATGNDVNSSGIFLFPLSSFSFVRNGRGERGKRKRKEKDSGGDITSCCTLLLAVRYLLLDIYLRNQHFLRA